YGPTNVHRKWIWKSGTDLWGMDPDDLQGRMPAFLPDVPTVRQDLVDYLGEVQAFDAALGVLLDELESRGLLENTLVVVSGDHGPAGFPHGKCNLYEFGSGVALAIAGPGVRGSETPGQPRVLDDLVSLPDLAPTFLEAAELPVPEVMTARSLWPSLSSSESPIADPSREHVLIGRERHVASARADFKPYPQRAIRTDRYLFIHNFRPERYPLGDPYRLGDSENEPTFAEIRENTFVTLPDEDAGPTKAWLVEHRNDPAIKPLFEQVYGQRPEFELYDMKADVHQMKNVANEPQYASIAEALRTRLHEELIRTGDPRMQDDGAFFENSPMSDPVVKKTKKRVNKK
ncbi:MAG: sulfatase-like hydrolase/transferase, partial [Planctomycetota bacterium]